MRHFFINLSDLFNMFDDYDYDYGFNNDYDHGHKNEKIDESKFNKEVEEFETDTHIVKKEVWTSIDGTSKYVKTYSQSKKASSSNLLKLEKELENAVKSENYEKAAELRDEIKKIKKGK